MIINSINIQPAVILTIDPFELKLAQMIKRFRVKTLRILAREGERKGEVTLLKDDYNRDGKLLVRRQYNSMGESLCNFEYDLEGRVTNLDTTRILNGQRATTSNNKLRYSLGGSSLSIFSSIHDENIQIKFDSRGNPIKVFRKAQFKTYPTEQIVYDSLGRVSEIEGIGPEANYTKLFYYDENGDLIKETTRYSFDKYGSDTLYKYDEQLLVEKTLVTKSEKGDTVAPTYYSYNQFGLLTEARIPYVVDIFERYDYDFWD